MQIQNLKVELFGSLALTGKGHATDTAVVLGLLGEQPDRLDPDKVPALVDKVTQRKTLDLPGRRTVAFDPSSDIVFKRQMLPRHPNAMRCTATGADAVFARTYYSVGGGFIVTDGEEPSASPDTPQVPYPFTTSAELLAMAQDAGLTIADLQRRNERSIRSDPQISQEIAHIWTVMQDCVARGLRQGGRTPRRPAGAPAGAWTACPPARARRQQRARRVARHGLGQSVRPRGQRGERRRWPSRYRTDQRRGRDHSRGAALL
jgi:L-serine dehydratase